MLAIETAVSRLSVIPYFPSSEAAVLEIMHQLEEMIGDEEICGTTPQRSASTGWSGRRCNHSMRKWGGIPVNYAVCCAGGGGQQTTSRHSSTLHGLRGRRILETIALAQHKIFKAIEAGRMPPTKLLEAAESDRVPDDEIAQLHVRDGQACREEQTPQQPQETSRGGRARTRRSSGKFTCQRNKKVSVGRIGSGFKKAGGHSSE